MIRLLLLLLALSTLAPSATTRVPVLRTGSAAPTTTCSASILGDIYLQTGDPASVISQVWTCSQSGASSYAWSPISHKTGTTAPATCSAGQVFFDSDATLGKNWFGCTGTNIWTPLSTTGYLSSPDYNFTAQAPGGSLTGGASATVTLTPCPIGVAGSDLLHYLYVSGGTGTAEAVLITGGTCTSGLSTGTVTFTPANSHSGAWTIQSATAGLTETQNICPTNGCEIHVPSGDYSLYGPFTKSTSQSVWITGEGPATNFVVSTQGPFTDSPKTPSQIVVSSNAATATSSAHGFVTGELIRISGATVDPDLNRVYRITRTGADTFTFTTVNVADATYTEVTLRATSRWGVFRVWDRDFPTQYQVSGGFRDFKVSFTQPDSLSIGDYTQYVPAFTLEDFYKPQIDRIVLALSWGGIQAYNGSGFSSTGLRFGGFGKAFDLDNIGDSVRIHDPHGWPMGATSNQVTTFISDADYFYYIGKLDDLHVTQGASITAKCANTHQGTMGVGYGLDGFMVFDGIDCDSNGGFEVAGGRVRLSNSFFSLGYGAASRYGQPAITQTGGSLLISNSEFYASSLYTDHLIDIVIDHSLDVNSYTPGAGGDEVPSFSLINSKISVNGDKRGIGVINGASYTGSTFALISGNSFRVPATGARTYALIDLPTNPNGSTRLTAIGNRVETHTSGSATFISISDPGEHIVQGNVSVGFLHSFPEATSVSGSFCNNQPSTYDTCQSWKYYRLAGVANGVGGCATANGCWSVNWGTPVAQASALTQDVTLFTLPAKGYISAIRIKTNTVCSGATTANTGLGTSGNHAFYRDHTYDIAAAVSATNLTDALAASGSTTASSTSIVASLVTTVDNVDQIADTCIVDYWIQWGVLP